MSLRSEVQRLDELAKRQGHEIDSLSRRIHKLASALETQERIQKHRIGSMEEDISILKAKATSVAAHDENNWAEERPTLVSPGDETH